MPRPIIEQTIQTLVTEAYLSPCSLIPTLYLFPFAFLSLIPLRLPLTTSHLLLPTYYSLLLWLALQRGRNYERVVRLPHDGSQGVNRLLSDGEILPVCSSE